MWLKGCAGTLSSLRPTHRRISCYSHAELETSLTNAASYQHNDVASQAILDWKIERRAVYSRIGATQLQAFPFLPPQISKPWSLEPLLMQLLCHVKPNSMCQDHINKRTCDVQLPGLEQLPIGAASTHYIYSTHPQNTPPHSCIIAQACSDTNTRRHEVLL